MQKDQISALAKLMDLFFGDQMKDRIIIVLDCGATNIRAVAVNQTGKMIAFYSVPNNTRSDPFYPSGLIWDIEEIWHKFAQCTRMLLKQLSPDDVSAITVTTFGVNGAPVDKNGRLLYPVISWQCQRTVPIMNGIEKYISLERLYALNGVKKQHFNTINTLIWLKENHPAVIKKMHIFLFLPSLFIQKLTGRMINDRTMLGTSMLTDINQGEISDEILKAIGIPHKFGDEIKEAGSFAGNLCANAADELGLIEGTPVILSGHDTQFALIGSGAGINEVVLSSGTWEILMTRTQNLNLTPNSSQFGITHEWDAIPGLYNAGVQWLGSGILEWIKQHFYLPERGENPEQNYELMIKEAESVNPVSSRVDICVDFPENNGTISGLGIHTSRGEIYRAALVALAEKTKQGLHVLQNAGQFKASALIVVGGASRNKLLNRIRTDTLGIPLKLSRQPETTVLGAAAFALTALGIYPNLHNTIEAISRRYEYVYPD